MVVVVVGVVVVVVVVVLIVVVVVCGESGLVTSLWVGGMEFTLCPLLTHSHTPQTKVKVASCRPRHRVASERAG